MRNYIVRIINLTLVFSLLNMQCAFASKLSYDVVGQFDDSLILPEYSNRFGMRTAVAYSELNVFKNTRFYIGVESSETLPNDVPNFVEKGRFNIRNDAPDYPVDWTAYILQRLFPSPDGINLIVNQGSDQDIVRFFTPQKVGEILNFIRDFDPLKGMKLYKEKLAETIRANFPKYRKAKLFNDFSHSLVEALKEQSEREVKSNPETAYFPSLIENALFYFSMQKAGEGQNPVQEMTSFYNAMPDIVVKNWTRLLPFDRQCYENQVKRVKECDYKLTPREHFQLLLGLKEYAQLFPVQQYYSTGQYQNVHFSTCAEISFLNVMNGFLWDFKEKRLRVEMLEKLPAVPGLVKYFKIFDTTEKQETRKGQSEWIQVVSGLKGADIVYKKGNGTCEISRGAASLAGVIRALFPDNIFLSISDDIEVSRLERVQRTLDHLLELFATEGDKWAWEVKGAERGQEKNFNKNAGIAVSLSKEGKNIPIVDDKPLDDPILTWEFADGHYNASFSEGGEFEFMRVMSVQRFNMSAFRSNILDQWGGAIYGEPIKLLLYRANLGYLDEEDKEEIVDICEKIDEQSWEPFWTKVMPTMNYRSQVVRGLVFSSIVALKYQHLYCFAANLLELMPLDDPFTNTAFIHGVVDEEGELRKQSEEIHSRVTKRREQILNWCEVPDNAYECLIEVGGTPGVFLFFFNKLPKSLEKEKVLGLLFEMASGFDYTSKIWELVLNKFGNVLEKEDSNNSSSENSCNGFMLYKPDEKSNSILEEVLECLPVETLRWFLGSGYISRGMLLPDSKSRSPLELINPSFTIQVVENILFICKWFDISKKEVLKHAPGFYNLFLSSNFKNQLFHSIIEAFQLTKEDFLVRWGGNGEQLGLIWSILSDPSLVERGVYLMELLKLTPDDMDYSSLGLISTEGFDALFKQGLVTRDDLLKKRNESSNSNLRLLRYSSYCLPNGIEHFFRICKELGITKKDLWENDPSFMQVFVDRDFDISVCQRIVKDFQLIKEDFLETNVIRRMLDNPKLTGHVSSLIEELGFTPSNFNFSDMYGVSLEGIEALCNRGMLRHGMYMEAIKKSVSCFPLKTHFFLCKKLSVSKEQIWEEVPMLFQSFLSFNDKPDPEFQEYIEYFKFTKEDFLKSPAKASGGILFQMLANGYPKEFVAGVMKQLNISVDDLQKSEGLYVTYKDEAVEALDFFRKEMAEYLP